MGGGGGSRPPVLAVIVRRLPIITGVPVPIASVVNGNVTTSQPHGLASGSSFQFSDLTGDAWDYGSTDGEIFIVIRDGVSADMLAYKEKLTEKRIWQVVNYIRSIGLKQSK